MKTKIFCWVGIMWGAGIVIRGFFVGPANPDSASGAGSLAAFMFGFILLGVSIYNLRKEYKKEDR